MPDDRDVLVREKLDLKIKDLQVEPDNSAAQKIKHILNKMYQENTLSVMTLTAFLEDADLYPLRNSTRFRALIRDLYQAMGVDVTVKLPGAWRTTFLDALFETNQTFVAVDLPQGSNVYMRPRKLTETQHTALFQQLNHGSELYLTKKALRDREWKINLKFLFEQGRKRPNLNKARTEILEKYARDHRGIGNNRGLIPRVAAEHYNFSLDTPARTLPANLYAYVPLFYHQNLLAESPVTINNLDPNQTLVEFLYQNQRHEFQEALKLLIHYHLTDKTDYLAHIFNDIDGLFKKTGDKNLLEQAFAAIVTDDFKPKNPDRAQFLWDQISKSNASFIAHYLAYVPHRSPPQIVAPVEEEEKEVGSDPAKAELQQTEVKSEQTEVESQPTKLERFFELDLKTQKAVVRVFQNDAQFRELNNQLRQMSQSSIQQEAKPAPSSSEAKSTETQDLRDPQDVRDTPLRKASASEINDHLQGITRSVDEEIIKWVDILEEFSKVKYRDNNDLYQPLYRRNDVDDMAHVIKAYLSDLTPVHDFWKNKKIWLPKLINKIKANYVLNEKNKGKDPIELFLQDLSGRFYANPEKHHFSIIKLYKMRKQDLSIQIRKQIKSLNRSELNQLFENCQKNKAIAIIDKYLNSKRPRIAQAKRDFFIQLKKEIIKKNNFTLEMLQSYLKKEIAEHLFNGYITARALKCIGSLYTLAAIPLGENHITLNEKEIAYLKTDRQLPPNYYLATTEIKQAGEKMVDSPLDTLKDINNYINPKDRRALPDQSKITFFNDILIELNGKKFKKS
jgi:hypothetical protein